MGAQYKGFSPYTIHYRVKAMLSASLRRHYMILQSGMWASTFLCVAGIIMLISLRISLVHYNEFNSHPVTVVSGVILAIGGICLLVLVVYFRCVLRPLAVTCLEQANRRRGRRLASRRAHVYAQNVILEDEEEAVQEEEEEEEDNVPDRRMKEYLASCRPNDVPPELFDDFNAAVCAESSGEKY